MSGMDGSPKVLSVTFGAFSVRLEGFDDPVATLIAVAEYLRGLAERDPGFARGAEVPDAAALLRELEVGREGPEPASPGETLGTTPPGEAPESGPPGANVAPEPSSRGPAVADGDGARTDVERLAALLAASREKPLEAPRPLGGITRTP